MNQYNNKDLYQTLGINKNASQQEINSLVLKTSPKDDPEVGKALMVLSDPQKKIEYDSHGWKDNWEIEWQSERDFRHSIFEEIQNYKHHYGNTYALKPDGFRVYVWADEHLDPSLFAPSSGFVDKIWDIRGPNWRQELENFKNKMLVALDEAWEREKKTPLLSDCWEAVENGNCAGCGKAARLRRKGEYSDGKDYCSQECYWENRYKVPKYELEKIKYEIPELEKPKLEKYECVGCHYKGYDCYKRGDGSFRCKACFNKELEELKNPSHKNKKTNHLVRCCDNCGEKIKEHEDENGSIISGVGSVDSDGNRHTFCSQECSEKFRKWRTIAVVRKNPFTELLKWMEKEGITNISLDPSSGKLTLEYGKNNSKTIEDDNLTSEQREIKSFFQQIGKTSLSQNEARAKAEAEEKSNNDNKWVKPLVVGGIIVVVITLIGIIIYKNKKKGY